MANPSCMTTKARQRLHLNRHPKPITLRDLSKPAPERSEVTLNTTGEQHD